MSQKLSMADLLAKQSNKNFSLSRGQEVEGVVVAILDQEIILDLGAKSEGVLSKKDLSSSQSSSLKVGDKISVSVIAPESESGQAIVTSKKSTPATQGGKTTINPEKWEKFQQALDDQKTLTAKGIEVNKGGLILETSAGVRGFLPSSQVSLSQSLAIDELVGKEIQVMVIEVDPSQNRLIFSQKANVTEEVKTKIEKLKNGDKVSGKVVTVLPFGIFVSLNDGVEGLVHISEIAWEKVEDPSKLFKTGDEVEAVVISTDQNTGKVNLSIKQLSDDPFIALSEKFQKDDIVKGIISRIASQGAYVTLSEGIEALMPTAKFEPEASYQVGQEITVSIEAIEPQKRRILVSPFLTTTKGLIYK